jgi:hypothetical protein
MAAANIVRFIPLPPQVLNSKQIPNSNFPMVKTEDTIKDFHKKAQFFV